MSEGPPGRQEDFPHAPMTRERFEHVLLGVRNAASVGITAQAVDELVHGEAPRPATEADQRAVWHAAEIALGILRPGYVPKREAIADMRALIAWIDGDDPSWASTD
jgi:hypothetical protein